MTDKQMPSQTQEDQSHILKTLGSVALSLTEDISLPTHLAAAMLSGRVALIKKIAPPESLGQEEIKAIYHAIGVLMETNELLRLHAGHLTKMVNDLKIQFSGTKRQMDKIVEFGNFRNPGDLDHPEDLE